MHLFSGKLACILLLTTVYRVIFQGLVYYYKVVPSVHMTSLCYSVHLTITVNLSLNIIVLFSADQLY